MRRMESNLAVFAGRQNARNLAAKRVRRALQTFKLSINRGPRFALLCCFTRIISFIVDHRFL